MLKFVVVILLIVLFGSCSQQDSVTGWNYNNPHNGGFQKVPYFEQETPPGMVLVEAGAYYLNVTERKKDSLTVSSFYASKCEETNAQYRAYLSDVKKFYSLVTYRNALPDTTVWKATGVDASTCEFLTKNYLRNPIYDNFPVVGLTPTQIKKYARWKTDRLNEYILIREGVITHDPAIQDSAALFSTKAYYANTWPYRGTPLPDLDPTNSSGKRNLGVRIVRMNDGILLPRMRLLTADEWQLAHLAIGDSNNRYIKTPKTFDFERYDKDNHFEFLIIPSIKMEKKSQVVAKPNGLKKVVNSTTNNYQIHHLNSNVAEVVGDSILYFTIGGSFNQPTPDNTAIFQDSISTGLRYKIPHPLHLAHPLDSNQCGLYGFRLGMDRIGSPRTDKKRYKYKGH